MKYLLPILFLSGCTKYYVDIRFIGEDQVRHCQQHSAESFVCDGIEVRSNNYFVIKREAR